jgi:hypothetical protein
VDEGSIAAMAQELVRRMPTNVPWARQQFIEVVAEYRERPVRLVPVRSEALRAATDSDTTCGLWLFREHDDLIVYGSDVLEYHADQIIGHEVGHMMLKHDERALVDPDGGVFSTLLPDLAGSTILKVLGRSSFEDEQEHDAEVFADLIMVEAMTVRQRRASLLRSTFFR